MQRATGPPPDGVKLYEELYGFDTLEAAYEVAFEYLYDIPESADEWIINVQNHLIWRSYEPGENPDIDVLVLSAIEIILKRYTLRPEDAGPEIKIIVDALTLV